MNIDMHYAFVLDTDHFQFYLEDLAIEHDTSLLWDHGKDPLLQTLDGLLAVGTARWGLNTPIRVEVYQEQPLDQNVTGWEHVREARLRTISGKLHITTPEGDNNLAPSIPITQGVYGVHVYYANLRLVGDELDAHGPDQYKLILWPEAELQASR